MLQKIRRLPRRIKERLIPLVTVAGLTTMFYSTAGHVQPGVITWAVCLPAWFVLFITALARVNDIKPEQRSFIYQLRRVGLSSVGAAAVAFATGPFTNLGYPTMVTVVLSWGMAFSWISSPGQPPWWPYVNGSNDELD
jgi:hypothetical protein